MSTPDPTPMSTPDPTPMPTAAPTPKSAGSDLRSELVVGAGSVTTLIALAGVFAAARSGTNIMGWYANYVIPAGAILVGLVAASGFGVAAWLSGLKMTKRLIWSVCGQLALSYFIAQYEQFRTDVPFSSPLGFWSWFDQVTQSFSWAQHDGSAGSPFGLLGYAMRALEVAGFVAGGAIVPLLLRTKPYCDPCRTYKRTRLIGLVPGEVETDDTDAILAAVTNGTRDDVQRELTLRGNMNRKRAVRKGYRYWNIELVRCPRCADGGVKTAVVTRNGNNVQISPIHFVELPPDRMRSLFD